MAMINTGLLLRRPFESDYSAYRRFLIANQTQSLLSLRAGLEKKLPTVYGTRCHLPDLAQLWEQQFCNQYKIPYHSPIVTSKRRPHLRNCPTCASLGYHSYLFQYPWFCFCPIHHKPLVQICSTCHQLWPNLSDLKTKKTSCSMCGIHYDINKLASMLITTENNGFEVLKQLDQAIQNSRKQSIRLVGVPWSQEVDIGRLVNRPESLDWVSLVHPRPQQWKRICALIGAPLQSASIRKYEISEFITEVGLRGYNSFDSGRSRVERSINRRILRELTPLIKKLSLSSRHSSSRISEHFGYFQTLDDENIFRVCFNTWRVLYSLGSQRHSVPYAQYFF